MKKSLSNPKSEAPPQRIGQPQIRVMIAHSQNLVAEALSEALGKDSHLNILSERPNMGLDAVELAIKASPDVVLLDHWLPVVGGPMATRMIMARGPGIRILVMSWLQSPSHIAEAVQAGAVGYLPMSVGLHQVRAAIQRAHAGEAAVFGEELMVMIEDLARREADSKQKAELVSALTPRDIRALWLLSSGRQMREVAEAMKITPGSLQMRLHHIFRKTGARSQIEAIAMARENGLIPTSYPA